MSGKGWRPTGRRMPVQFSSSVDRGQSVEIVHTPQGENAVRIARLWVKPPASRFIIEAVRVGIEGKKLDLQAELFTETDGQIFESFAIAVPPMDIGLTVYNFGEARSRFEALLFLELLEPYPG